MRTEFIPPLFICAGLLVLGGMPAAAEDVELGGGINGFELSEVIPHSGFSMPLLYPINAGHGNFADLFHYEYRINIINAGYRNAALRIPGLDVAGYKPIRPINRFHLSRPETSAVQGRNEARPVLGRLKRTARTGSWEESGNASLTNDLPVKAGVSKPSLALNSHQEIALRNFTRNWKPMTFSGYRALTQTTERSAIRELTDLTYMEFVKKTQDAVTGATLYVPVAARIKRWFSQQPEEPAAGMMLGRLEAGIVSYLRKLEKRGIHVMTIGGFITYAQRSLEQRVSEGQCRTLLRNLIAAGHVKEVQIQRNEKGYALMEGGGPG